MIRIFKGKMGVSPLIATVLLIAFAVSLGAVVMNWGRGYVESTAEMAEAQSAEKISCSMDTSMGIVQVGRTQRLCLYDDTDGATLNFSLINTGLVDLEGIAVTAILNSGEAAHTDFPALTPVAKSKVLFGSLVINDTDLSSVADLTVDDIAQIEISPIINVRGVDTVCLEHSIKRIPAEISKC